MARDPKSDLVFGGTNNGHFFIWDPKENTKTLDIVPVQADWGSKRSWWDYCGVTSLCVAKDKVFMSIDAGRWVGSEWKQQLGHRLIVFDIPKKNIIHKSRLNFGVPRENTLALHTDGLIYGLTNKCIYSIDPESFKARQVAISPVPIYCGWAMTEKGIYFGSGVNLWRYNW